MWGPGHVEAVCAFCGPIRLEARQVTLSVCDDAVELCRYQYACPTCKTEVDNQACAHVAAELMRIGARVVRWKIPAEALEFHDGPPLTADDLIDLHQQLAAL